MIKKLFKILFYFLFSLIVLLSVASVLLNTDKGKQLLLTQITGILSSEINTTVSIEKAQFSLFDKIELENVYVEDQAKDTLLFAQALKLKVDLFALLNNQFIIKQLKVEKMLFSIKNDSLKGNNFDFILESFKNKDRKKSKNILYQFKFIQLTDCRVCYDSNKRPPEKERFDVYHLDFKALNSKISIQHLNKDSLSVELKELSFYEKSGLNVQHFQSIVQANKKSMKISNLSIQMPASHVQIGDVEFGYKNLNTFNHFTDSIKFNFEIKPSSVSLTDFACFSPQLKNLNHPVQISGMFQGPISKLNCPYLSISYGNTTRFSGDFQFLGLPNVKNAFVFARVSNFKSTKNDLEDFIADLTNNPFVFPSQFNNINQISFKGKLTGYLNNLAASGEVKTNLGNIYSDVGLISNEGHQLYKGFIKSDKFQLGQLLDKKEIGDISLDVRLDGEKQTGKAHQTNVKGVVSSFTYNNYVYNNILLNGDFSNHIFKGKIDLNDNNGKVDLEGVLDFSNHLPLFNIKASVEDFYPYKMNLINQYPDLSFSLFLQSKIKGNRLDNIVGNIIAENIYLKNGTKELLLEKFEMNSDISDSLSSMIIVSDVVNGVIEGKYTLSTLVSSIQYVASEYLPVLNQSKNKKQLISTDNNFDFDIRIDNIESFSNLLDLKWKTSSTANVFGFYDDKTRKFRLKGILPDLQYKKIKISELTLLCENPTDAINLYFNAKTWTKSNNSIDVFFKALAKNDSLLASLEWNNNLEKVYAGKISSITNLNRGDDAKLLSTTQILPTNIIFSDTIWNIRKSIIKTENERIFIENFLLERKNEFVKINGIASKSPEDTLVVKLNNLRLGYLHQFLPMGIIHIDGFVTGQATIKNVFKNTDFEISAGVKDFVFNHTALGDALVHSVWDKQEKRLVSNVDIQDKQNPIAKVQGFIYPKAPITLDLLIKADGLKIDFLQPFLQSVLQNVKGTASTKSLKMSGNLGKPLFDGNVYVKNAVFSIDYFKTNYHFSDTVKITKNSFSFSNTKLYDSENNSGILSGVINHQLYQNFRYNIHGNFKNILGINTKKTDNPDFYGKVYGSGTLRIQGNSNTVTFDIGMKTEPNSKLFIPFATSLNASDNSFITFADKKKQQEYVKNRESQISQVAGSNPTVAPKINMKVNLQIDATPDGEIQLIVDPVGGDVIRATGNGSLKMVYDDSEDIKLYGNYVINSGLYHFTLQNVINKNFKITQGSTINWNGSPYTPDINIDAVYALSASLLDLLDESMLTDINRSTVPVSCLLNLTGDLTQPNIKFDIALPSSSDELERRVKNVISSDEMMNRQIMYLLTMGRFYSPDYMRTSQTGNSELSSLVSSTLSSQLNSWLSQINDNFSMGVNYRSASEGELTSTEVELVLGGEVLNNRLIFNGNVGYRDDVLAPSNFIGDFDLEYKLNKSGKLRAKAYTHSNDKYYIKNSTTTQGAGIIYKEDFDSFSELFSSWTKVFRKRKSKDIKQETKKDSD